LKSYLQMENRPHWAQLDDAILRPNAQKSGPAFENHQRVNCFLQSWSPNTHKGLRMPESLKEMIKTGQKYKVRIESTHPSNEAHTNLLFWDHLKTRQDIKQRTSKARRCLAQCHSLVLVKDATALSKRLGAHLHKKRRDCRCEGCKQD
ncbi:hypothetical protein EV421DRAFT_1658020, partial [Armillaria borealis]